MSREEDKPISPHPVVAALVPHPAQPFSGVMLRGYVGRSADPALLVVFTNAQLSSSATVARADVLRVESNPRGEDTIWVRADARVQIVERTLLSAQATFLDGAIAGGNLAAGPALGMGAMTVTDATVGKILSKLRMCATDPFLCQLPTGISVCCPTPFSRACAPQVTADCGGPLPVTARCGVSPATFVNCMTRTPACW